MKKKLLAGFTGILTLVLLWTSGCGIGKADPYVCVYESKPSGSWIDHSYDENGLRTDSTSYDSEGTVDGTITYTYDEDGRETGQIWRSGSYTAYVNNEYDEDGNRIRQTSTMKENDDDAEVLISGEETYEYDEDGKLTHITSQTEGAFWWYSSSSEGTPTYDEEGNLVSETYYDTEDGELTNYIEYEYDSDGKLIRKMEYGTDGKLDDDEQTGYEYMKLSEYLDSMNQ